MINFSIRNIILMEVMLCNLADMYQNFLTWDIRSLHRAFSTLRPSGLLYSYPQQVPSFISRGATHHADARDLYQPRREILPMNFASKSVIHENPLGSFTCRKAGT